MCQNILIIANKLSGVVIMNRRLKVRDAPHCSEGSDVGFSNSTEGSEVGFSSLTEGSEVGKADLGAATAVEAASACCGSGCKRTREASERAVASCKAYKVSLTCATSTDRFSKLIANSSEAVRLCTVGLVIGLIAGAEDGRKAAKLVLKPGNSITEVEVVRL